MEQIGWRAAALVVRCQQAGNHAPSPQVHGAEVGEEENVAKDAV